MLENEACLSDSSSSSSCSSSDESDLMLVDTTSLLLQHATRIIAGIDGGTEDSTIKWRQYGGLLIQDVSEDDAITHFWFRTRHLQEVADKLWPRVREHLHGVKTAVTYDSGSFLSCENSCEEQAFRKSMF
jgi:hypothetical protein